MRRAQITIKGGPNWPLEYFGHHEIACKHCGEVLLDEHAGVCLDRFRAFLGRPVYVLSGYRCPEHNFAVGGAVNSLHMQGMAFDVKCVGWKDRAQMIHAASRVGFEGIGVYLGFLHIDVGPRRFWA